MENPEQLIQYLFLRPNLKTCGRLPALRLFFWFNFYALFYIQNFLILDFLRVLKNCTSKLIYKLRLKLAFSVFLQKFRWPGMKGARNLECSVSVTDCGSKSTPETETSFLLKLVSMLWDYHHLKAMGFKVEKKVEFPRPLRVKNSLILKYFLSTFDEDHNLFFLGNVRRNMTLNDPETKIFD